MWDLEAADEYIRYHTLDNEDWFDADEDRKIALLNVASETLTTRFQRYLDDPNSGVDEIPDAAIYVFAATLGWAFNDTNKMSLEGIKSTSIRGMYITFKDGKNSIFDLIPDSVYQIIGLPIPKLGGRIIPLVM